MRVLPPASSFKTPFVLEKILHICTCTYVPNQIIYNCSTPKFHLAVNSTAEYVFFFS